MAARLLKHVWTLLRIITRDCSPYGRWKIYRRTYLRIIIDNLSSSDGSTTVSHSSAEAERQKGNFVLNHTITQRIHEYLVQLLGGFTINLYYN